MSPRRNCGRKGHSLSPSPPPGWGPGCRGGGSWARARTSCICKNLLQRLLARLPSKVLQSPSLLSKALQFSGICPDQEELKWMGRYAPGNTHLPKRTEWSLKSTCVQIQLTSLYAVSIPGQGLCKQLEPIRGGGGERKFPSFFPCNWGSPTVFKLIFVCMVVGGSGGTHTKKSW